MCFNSHNAAISCVFFHSKMHMATSCVSYSDVAMSICSTFPKFTFICCRALQFPFNQLGFHFVMIWLYCTLMAVVSVLCCDRLILQTGDYKTPFVHYHMCLSYTCNDKYMYINSNNCCW